MANCVKSAYMKGNFATQSPVHTQYSGNNMCVLILSSFCVLLFSLSQCSSIITRSMIRMPEKVTSLFSGTQVTGATLPEPSKLVTSADNRKYEIIHPLTREESVQSRSLELDKTFSKVRQENTSDVVENNRDFRSNFSSYKNDDTNNLISTKEYGSLRDNIGQLNLKTDEKHSNPKYISNLTSQEISSKYWDQYRNFSADFFNTTNVPVKDPSVVKQFPQFNVWAMLQSFYKCMWTSGFVSCLEGGIGDISPTDTFSFFQFLTPRLPRNQMFDDTEEQFNNSNDNLEEFIDPNEDEGRRRLSKKLQIILPILMILKMTMLPALAVMALVTGKAFLMSLLSLGVALIAASMQLPLLRADKRHEVMPQSPLTNDHAPNSYYYMK